MSIAEQIIAWVDRECSLREFSEVTVDEGRALKGQALAIERMLMATAVRVPKEPHALFRLQATTLHSGERSRWKIDCDALTDGDIATLADLIAERVGPFSAVEGVPNGGLRLAEALRRYQTSHRPLLIVDDVLTTGASLEAQRAGREAIGAVIFARREPPSWVSALFQMPPLVAPAGVPQSEAERTVASIAAMLGWMNVPPRDVLERDIAALKARVKDEPLTRLVDQQAEDEGLWFVAQTAAEAYLQQELRRLHAAIEQEPS